MYIIFNSDGSIKHSNLTDFIQKGNDGVNSIFLALDGLDTSEWGASVYCTLPNDEVEGPITLTPQEDVQIGEETYDGYLFTIGAEITAYEGNVKFSLNVIDGYNHSLFTFRTTLTINPSSVIPDETKISVAQYNNLLQYIASAVGTPDLLKPIFIGEATTTILSIIGEDDPHTGSKFVVDFADRNGLYIYIYGNCVNLIPVYGVNNTTKYNISACLKSLEGEFSVQVLSYQFERQGAHPDKADFKIFSNEDIIPIEYESSLYRIKLY